MTVLDEWVAVVCGEFDIDRGEIDVRVILDLARDVAHHVDRPAAPMTAFLLGVAVGAGHPIAEAAARLSALAAGWGGDSAPGEVRA